MSAVKFYSCVVLSLLLVSHCTAQRRTTTPKSNSDECALFKANDAEALSSGQSTYLELGEMDVSDHFSLSMDVFPSTLSHNGILFSLGSKPNFEYYEWKTDAVKTQYIVVEFLFSALALTLKAFGTQHLHQVEVYKTFPIPYSIDDARWHTVKVSRNKGAWVVKIDELTQTEVVTNKTDVQLFGKPAFLGGRPEYTDHQFQGVIKRLRVNNRLVQMGGRLPHGRVEVWHCSAEEVSHFITFLKQQRYVMRN